MEPYAGDEEQPGKRSAAIRHSYEGMIRQHEDELREYDQSESWRADYLCRSNVRTILPHSITMIRIAEGVANRSGSCLKRLLIPISVKEVENGGQH